MRKKHSKNQNKQATMKVLFFKLNVKNMWGKKTLSVCNLKPLIHFGLTAFDLLELGIHLVGSFMVVVCGDLVELSTLQTEKQREKPESETNARKCDCYLLCKGEKRPSNCIHIFPAFRLQLFRQKATFQQSNTS